MDHFIRVLTKMLGAAARLLPPGRRQWAEAAAAEAGQTAAGWPRLRWLAGGLWLVAREARVLRKAGYWCGVAVVTAVAAWAVWVSWRTTGVTDPQSMTDRFRVLAGVGALVVLPWAGRRQGWFGPVGGSITARLVRVSGCAAICGLGIAVVRFDSHVGLGPGAPGPFSLPREIAGLVISGAVLGALPVIKARWPATETAVLCSIAGFAGVVELVLLPLQLLAVGYVAAILVVTSRRSPLPPASLAVATLTGLATGLLSYGMVLAVRGIDQLFIAILLLAGTVCLLAAAAGAAAAWLLPGTEDPQQLRVARIRQGLIAGALAGAVGGLLLTLIGVAAVAMMLIGPVAGAVGGAAGSALAADHPRSLRPARSWATGLRAPGRAR